MVQVYYNGDTSPNTSTLWLGQRLNTPFEDVDGLVTGNSSYEENSAGKRWPTFRYSKAHRLHDIKTLCSACDQIDITELLDGGPPVLLRNSFFEIARTASHCRFCSLIAQSARGVYGTLNERDFLSVMGSQDAVVDCPVLLDVKDSILNVRVPLPEHWPCRIVDGNREKWDLGSFEITESITDISSGEMMDLSLVGKAQMPCTAQNTIDLPVHSLPGELQRIVKATGCEDCMFLVDGMIPQQASGIKHPVLPDRIIEISDAPNSGVINLRLQETQGHQTGRYVALSHRWGGVTLTTTKDRLAGYLRALHMEELPRTFQDAVLVTKALGIRYLWVDSLCIVQDDEADWLEQAPKMGAIYMNSTFTIAAHSARKCNEGFLWRYQVPSVLLIAPKKGGPDFLVSIPDLDDEQVHRRFVESEISRRAWILQELTLSKKILHFVENHVVFECEHQPPEMRRKTLVTPATIFWESKTHSDTHTLWRSLVERYTECRITKSGDKLVALAGISNVLQGVIDDPQDKHYHCGVFQADITKSLLWFVPDEVERHLERAPSWSWASADGPIRFLRLQPQDESTRTLARIKHVWHEDYLDKAISQPSCQLVIEAPVIRITAGMVIAKRKRLKYVPENGPDTLFAVVKHWPEKETYGWCIQDEVGILGSAVGYMWPGQPIPLVFLAISGRQFEGALAGAWCVVTTPANKGLGIYRRIGLGYVRDVECIVSASMSPEIVTLA